MIIRDLSASLLKQAEPSSTTEICARFNCALCIVNCALNRGDFGMGKNLEFGYLLDIYGELLTEKQYEMLDLYYNGDLSLAEIAQQHGISRQGVHDSIKRGEELLLGYEKVLKLSDRQREYEKTLRELKGQALDILEECRKITFGKNIADKTIVLLENLDKKLEAFEYSEAID